jgi:colicin import membrane protein
MAGFVREHWRPLAGAALLHVGVLAAIALAAWQWPRKPQDVRLAIEGVAIDERQLPASRPRTAPPVPKPEPEPVEPQPDPAEEARLQAEEEAKRAAEAERVRREVEEQALQREREAEAAREAEAKRVAEQQQKEREAEEAKRKELEERRKQEAAAAEAKRQAAREAELRRSLEAEEEAQAVARSGVVDEYRRMLMQAIERNWNRPPSARPGLECTLNVTQAPGGTVLEVSFGPCNGDAAVRESITNAVFRASPLPPPPDRRAFERKLQIVFRPTE